MKEPLFIKILRILSTILSFILLWIVAVVVFIPALFIFACLMVGERIRARKKKIKVLPKEKEGIADKIVREAAEKIKMQAEIDEKKKKRSEEIVKRPLLLCRVIKLIWKRKVGCGMWPAAIIEGKNKKEKISIKVYSAFGSVSVYGKNIKGLRFGNDLGRLDEKEIEAIENWLIDNYKED